MSGITTSENWTAGETVTASKMNNIISSATLTLTAHAGDITPSDNNTYDLGSTTKEFKDGYFDGKVYTDQISMVNDQTTHGIILTQSGELAANNMGLYVYSNTDQTESTSELLFVEQDNASSAGGCVHIQNDGTGNGMGLFQNGNGRMLNCTSSSTDYGIFLNQSGVLASGKHGLEIYSNVAQVTDSLVLFDQNHASSDKAVLEIVNGGTGNSLLIDQDGSATALTIDTEVANDGVALNIDVAGTSPQPVQIIRNDDVTGNVVLRLGAGYIWVDATGDLRISSTTPTSDTGGTVVGAQTA